MQRDEFTDEDVAQLSNITNEQMNIPCAYRTKLWPVLPTKLEGQQASDFLNYLRLPNAMKQKISGLVQNSPELSASETSHRLRKTESCTSESDNLSNDNDSVEKSGEDQAEQFILSHSLALNDINRTLSQTQLFCQHQPLFKPLCELVTAVSISNQKYVQGISVLCATVLLYSQSQQEALSIIFHITQSQIY